MKVFIVTDNEWWLSRINRLFSKYEQYPDIYCSPTSIALFKDRIAAGDVECIDISQAFEELIQKYDLGFSIHCKQIFPKQLVESIPSINVHPGKNPYNRGWYPQVFSLINEMPVGATIHYMNQEIDNGPIIASASIETYPWDTSRSVYERILPLEYELLDCSLDKILADDVKVNDSHLGGAGSYNSISDFEKLCELDLNENLSMREAIARLRALTHPPYKNAYFMTDDGTKVFLDLNVYLEKRTANDREQD